MALSNHDAHYSLDTTHADLRTAGVSKVPSSVQNYYVPIREMVVHKHINHNTTTI
jgi:hypothetical protein